MDESGERVSFDGTALRSTAAVIHQAETRPCSILRPSRREVADSSGGVALPLLRMGKAVMSES
jgi:hypothetical protein